MLNKKSIAVLMLTLLILGIVACKATAPSLAQGHPPANPPNLAVAAKTLGITEQELKVALGPPPPNLAETAQTLGITEQELQIALFPANAPVAAQPDKPTTAPQTTTNPIEVSPISSSRADAGSYSIIDTGQTACYSDGGAMACPQAGESFYGQDAQYAGIQPSYENNGDGTVTDLNTGLMWQQSPDTNGDGTINANDKMNFETAQNYANTLTLAGYNDWRLPTIKELYSLMNFNGATGTVPYLDTNYFDFAYGDTSAGERDIDAQFASSTLYVSDVMNGDQAMFGVNFADGRIKGYGIGANQKHPDGKTFYVLYVRGSNSYGINSFVDNGNGTITDEATGLTWMQTDSGVGLNWQESLNYCESLDYAGYTDWRLPDAKELQSIVDYSRSPDTTNSAAIDPLFQATLLPNGVNNSGEANYGHYWTSTTHLDGRVPGERAVYLAFGEARGVMDTWGGQQLMDVHGAGAQRSDQKSGDPDALPVGFGPQGDVQSINNLVRCVRNGAQFVEGAGTGTDTPAQPSGSAPAPGGQSPAGGSPPQEAVNACTGLRESATCQFTAPHGEITGSCRSLAEGQLACVPAGGPPSPQ